ncbi:hypothetical protein HYPSUDRAFT_202481 [Hypholoma sublateritium FD-334 SS-4]|uniref:Uncharacterized protein n=1 Tax=Hypholoma sublateritium (strain FD-334 SS-4) TaxID=945553 RepID=A0A0D2L517_HYPSF|nr:hypothetical protein HYPSUDRAFT_202481 [Hypholoma sublateritium FD-334 SS-4]
MPRLYSKECGLVKSATRRSLVYPRSPTKAPVHQALMRSETRTSRARMPHEHRVQCPPAVTTAPALRLARRRHRRLRARKHTGHLHVRKPFAAPSVHPSPSRCSPLLPLRSPPPHSARRNCACTPPPSLPPVGPMLLVLVSAATAMHQSSVTAAARPTASSWTAADCFASIEAGGRGASDGMLRKS